MNKKYRKTTNRDFQSTWEHQTKPTTKQPLDRINNWRNQRTVAQQIESTPTKKQQWDCPQYHYHHRRIIGWSLAVPNAATCDRLLLRLLLQLLSSPSSSPSFLLHFILFLFLHPIPTLSLFVWTQCSFTTYLFYPFAPNCPRFFPYFSRNATSCFSCSRNAPTSLGLCPVFAATSQHTWSWLWWCHLTLKYIHIYLRNFSTSFLNKQFSIPFLIIF